jgi:hypothetical protein
VAAEIAMEIPQSFQHRGAVVLRQRT